MKKDVSLVSKVNKMLHDKDIETEEEYIAIKRKLGNLAKRKYNSSVITGILAALTFFSM